jgi:hypothetical protein
LYTLLGVLEGGPALLKGLLYSWMLVDMRYFNSFEGKFMTSKGQNEMVAGIIEQGPQELARIQKYCDDFA